METDQGASRQFGDYVKRLRTNRKFGSRELARKAGIDSGTMTRLEQGKICSPRIDTLKRLAGALEVPVADLYAVAGYSAPYDVPGISSYLHAYYGYLPEERVQEINEYIERILDQYDDEQELRRGPVLCEDETIE